MQRRTGVKGFFFSLSERLGMRNLKVMVYEQKTTTTYITIP